MPRKPLDRQHNGRYVRRWISGDNNHRKAFKCLLTRWPDRYWEMITRTGDWAVIRNPRMTPLLHKGRKP